MAENTKPRLRFAPSPTGYLHIGGVRTALFNWLWARKTGGSFVLRIEDTDRERSTEENEQIILRDMRWLGLDWDEGPDIGGSHGPYRQMDRLATYREYADKLVASGKAYRCYATKDELDAARAKLKEENPKAQFRYPGWWRDKEPSDWPSDQPYVVRLKTPDSDCTEYDDLVFGPQRVANVELQDVVLMRSDGVPLYNLGCVVDDLCMDITLVARGRDHMVNTPIQVLLYKALGARVPQFAHLPMMLGKGGAKLSKRHGAVAVGEYRNTGVPAAGLLNYLARFGWSYGDQEVFAMDDLIDKFNWERCNRADGKFDGQKLVATCFEHMKTPELISDEAYMVSLESALVERRCPSRHGVVDRAKLKAVLPAIRPRARNFRDGVASIDWLFAERLSFDPKARAKFIDSKRGLHLAKLHALVAEEPQLVAADVEQKVKSWAEQEGVKLGAVAQPARVALTGRTVSPGIFEVMELLGRELTLVRLAAAQASYEAWKAVQPEG